MMESLNDSPERDLNTKQINQEQPEDDMKLNGDLNGSYDDEDIVDNSDLAENESTNDSHTNGEIVSSTDQVPSHENGVDKMDVDPELDIDPEPSGDFLGDSEPEDIEMTQEEEEQLLEEPDVHLAEEEDDDITENDKHEDLDIPVGIDSDKESEKEDETGVQISEVKESLVQNNCEISRTEDTVSLLPSNGRSHGNSDKKTDHDSKKIQLSKELEDLTKISSRGSLEITLVKKEPPKNRNEDKRKNVDVVTIIDDSKDSPTKGKTSEDDDCIEISPEKSSSKKKKVQQPMNITPRRSSRNLNKNKSYSDKDMYIEELDKKSDDEVQEIIPVDPLADDRRKVKKTTIVVNDTKKLVEIAAGSKQRTGKKEPTLVIIDTNSIMSGKGAVPINQLSQSSNSMAQMSFTQGRQGFSMVPVNVGSFQGKQKNSSSTQITPSQPKPVILPSLTDDMYVVEAPSFIVPYVYEKPPVTPLKEYVDDMDKILKELNKEEKRKKKDRVAEKAKDAEKLKEETSSEKGSDEIADKEDESDKKSVKSEKMDVDEDEDKKDEDKKNEDDIKKEEDKKDEDEKKEIEEDEETDKKDIKVEKKKIKEKLDEDTESETKSVNDRKSEKDSDTETDDEGKDSDSSSKKDEECVEVVEKGKKSENYFDNPLGKFFMQIGVNLVQEHVQTDLLRNQKRKRDRDGKNCPADVQLAIDSLLRTLEFSKENNKPYKLELQKCQFCNFKTESALVMSHHLETPHMKNYVYRCNYCTLEVRSPHDILFHMESEHNVRGRLERAPAYHQCPNCPFEDNQKGKLSRHLLSCAKKYKPERNQDPPIDWEPPAKIPRVRGSRVGLSGSSLYSASLAPRSGVPMSRLPSPSGHSLLASRGRGRPPIYINRSIPDGRSSSPHHKFSHMRAGAGMVFRPSSSSNAQPVLLPGPYNSLYQKGSSASVAAAAAGATAKLLQQPSISITPLPRQPNSMPNSSPQMQPSMAKPGRPPGTSKSTFVICEICDGYIKDLEQLRNHMQWIHKVKIHPKMIYNRPPLNCQKCQFRFFTDQGLERHLLGSHGLVTSSMQEAANKGKDGGRCPVCGRVYQWKLLNHVARDHNMSLKPAHLSYKCTVCTATFGMYKQFENHVYSAHSVVAKRVMDKKPGSQQPSTSSSSQPTSRRKLEPVKKRGASKIECISLTDSDDSAEEVEEDDVTLVDEVETVEIAPKRRNLNPQPQPKKQGRIICVD